LSDPQSLNMYSYVGNDPVNRMDPSGLFWGKLWRAIKKIVTSKWFQIALAVAIIVIAHYYPNSIFGFLGGGSSAGQGVAPALQIAPAAHSAAAAAAASAAAAHVAVLDAAGIALEGAAAASGIASAVSLGLAGALAAGQIGGQFNSDQQKQIEDRKSDVKKRLQNPDCAKLLGGLKNAQGLLSRARVLNPSTLSRSFRGTAGLYSKAANLARSEAANAKEQLFGYSESSPFASVNGKKVLPRVTYLFNRFFTETPSQQETIFIHELNRLNGYSGTYKDDYANITKACGTAAP